MKFDKIYKMISIFFRLPNAFPFTSSKLKVYFLPNYSPLPVAIKLMLTFFFYLFWWSQRHRCRRSMNWHRQAEMAAKRPTLVLKLSAVRSDLVLILLLCSLSECWLLLYVNTVRICRPTVHRPEPFAPANKGFYHKIRPFSIVSRLAIDRSVLCSIDIHEAVSAIALLYLDLIDKKPFFKFINTVDTHLLLI